MLCFFCRKKSSKREHANVKDENVNRSNSDRRDEMADREDAASTKNTNFSNETRMQNTFPDAEGESLWKDFKHAKNTNVQTGSIVLLANENKITTKYPQEDSDFKIEQTVDSQKNENKENMLTKEFVDDSAFLEVEGISELTQLSCVSKTNIGESDSIFASVNTFEDVSFGGNVSPTDQTSLNGASAGRNENIGDKYCAGTVDIEDEISFASNTPSRTDGFTSEKSDCITKNVEKEKLNSDASAQYKKACDLLYEALIKREKSLTVSEQTFLRNLISRLPDDDDASIISAATTDIETASAVLVSDPLFQTPVRNDFKETKPIFPKTSKVPSPLKCKKSGSISSSFLDKHETKYSKIIKDELANDNTEAAPYVSLSDVLDKKENGISSFSDDDENQNEIIRFDGWKDFQDDDDMNSKYSFKSPFRILGTSASDKSSEPHVLSPPLMEALQGFLPDSLCSCNFWMKFSLVKDGASLTSLLEKMRTTFSTIIAIETTKGEVFGAFTSSPWRRQTGYFGSGESFLWKLKQCRLVRRKDLPKLNDSTLEIYPFTGCDDFIQLCSDKRIIVGGGEWKKNESPYPNEHSGVGLSIDEYLLRGESSSCSTFANPPLCMKSDEGSFFDISNMEVWTVTPCNTETEAENLELRKLFVERNRT